MINRNKSNDSNSDFTFFDDCCSAFIAGKYVDAALILERGLRENKDRVRVFDQSDILERFLARLIFLKGESELAETEPVIKLLSNQREPNNDLRCSFCGKPRSEADKLIAGPRVYICNECIDICNEILPGL